MKFKYFKFDSGKFLGRPCGCGAKFANTVFTLYNKRGECIECNRVAQRKRYAENKEYYREYQRKSQARKYRESGAFRIRNLIRRGMNGSLKGDGKGGRRWQDLVGYTVAELEERLRSTMPEGCTWQDFMDGKLHIDHIIPMSMYNYKTPEDEDFKRCWALDNLRLLPAIENMKKGNKLDGKFIPRLLPVAV